MIKIGRRGSISGQVTVNGRQGHAAYPQLADNPVRGLLQLADALLDPAFDTGTKDFQPTNLEITSIDVGNPATNVIPAQREPRLQYPLQRQLDGRNDPGAKSTTGWTAPRAGRPTGRAARSRSTSSSSGATGRAMCS